MSVIKKKEIIIKKIVGKPKSSFVTTPKRIHTISLRERLLWALDKQIPNSETTIVQLAELASWIEQAVQLAERASQIEQAVQLACSASWTSPTLQFGESDQLASLRSVLVAPSFGIGSNQLLFCLNRSHHWNFTI